MSEDNFAASLPFLRRHKFLETSVVPRCFLLVFTKVSFVGNNSWNTVSSTENNTSFLPTTASSFNRFITRKVATLIYFSSDLKEFSLRATTEHHLCTDICSTKVKKTANKSEETGSGASLEKSDSFSNCTFQF